jgi:hypothetical protein
VNRGVPLTMSHPRSAVARAIRKVATGLVKDFQPETLATKSGSGDSRRRGLFRSRQTASG